MKEKRLWSEWNEMEKKKQKLKNQEKKNQRRKMKLSKMSIHTECIVNIGQKTFLKRHIAVWINTHIFSTKIQFEEQYMKWDWKTNLFNKCFTVCLHWKLKRRLIIL